MHIESIQTMIEAGEHRKAVAALRSLLDADPAQANMRSAVFSAERIAEREPDSFKRSRLAILPTFTADPLIPYVRARGYVSGLDVETYLGPFNQIQQQVFAEQSGLWAFDPGMIVLAWRSEEFVPSLFHDYVGLSGDGEVEGAVDVALQDVRAILAAIRGRTAATVIVHNFQAPAVPAFGILDASRPAGQADAFARLNTGLAEATRELPGVYVVDYAQLVTRVGHQAWHDPRTWLLARMPLSSRALPVLAETYISYLRALSGLGRKCLVLDLDGVMWGGIVGEDGLEGIQLGQDFPGSAYVALQRVALEMERRGVILALNSKNNEADALEVFDEHPEMILRREHLSATRINWQDKATNMRELAEELNIGLDQMVFLDDSPVERELIRTQTPEVLVIELPSDPTGYAAVVQQLRDFDGLSWTDEDRERTRMYQAQTSVREFASATASLDEFYEGLEMRVTIGRPDASTVARVAQLTQRTNQFNLTTRRYSEADIADLGAAPDADALWLRLEDRFGDSGIVGVAITRAHGDVWEIDSLLMSCRGLGRTVEDAFLAFMADEARSAGAVALRGVFVPTKKNAQVAEFYSERGFVAEDEPAAEGKAWRMELSSSTLAVPRWIDLRTPELSAHR